MDFFPFGYLVYLVPYIEKASSSPTNFHDIFVENQLIFNANQKHNEILPHTYQNGCYKKQEIIHASENVEKREPLCNLDVGTATMENGGSSKT